MTLVGLEPTIPGSVGRCLIHWATGPVGDSRMQSNKTWWKAISDGHWEA